jgi:Peptidase inhibitor I78 family
MTIRIFIAALLAAMPAIPAIAQPALPNLVSCNAAHLTRHIGKPYTDLQRIRPSDARYVCSTCPMTMDFRTDRLTVTYDRKTGLVTRLRCV